MDKDNIFSLDSRTSEIRKYISKRKLGRVDDSKVAMQCPPPIVANSELGTGRLHTKQTVVIQPQMWSKVIVPYPLPVQTLNLRIAIMQS